jgi:murein DD-endopeptidase MepM/ murein hydrolase activator NlpD
MEQLARRQKTLEARTSALSGLPDDVATGSVRTNPRALHRKGEAESATPKPSPISDTVILAPPLERRADLESRTPVSPVRSVGKKTAGMLAVLDRMQESLDRVETKQSAFLLALEDGYEAKAQRLRRAFTDLGLHLGKTAEPPAAGVGGPFVPPTLGRDAGFFERQMRRVQIARASLDRLGRVMQTVPLRKPLPGEIETSSGFGVRLDPFLRRPAMHTGLDMRGEMGEPVRATAAGTVTVAGWSGGYGRMVEVDHGNGLATRYGHMSAILVKEGQTVKPGQIVGRIGSTGRSTGPHLHYETRIDGEPVDPLRFLRAGLRLGQAL